jgi:hypothetical protein
MASERIAVEDIVEAAARGALRALDARRASEVAAGNAVDLVRAGFAVQVVIRAGGYPIGPQISAELNPQPLPPRQEA